MRKRQRVFFKVISIILILAISLSSPSAYSASAKSITSSEVQSKLNMLLEQFPANVTWNRSFAGGIECYAFAHYIFNTIFDRGNTQVGNGALPNNPTCYKLNNVASDINTIGTLAPGYSFEQLENLLESAMPGDYLQVKRRKSGNPHSMIITWVDANNNKIGIFDANAGGTKKVGQYNQSFSDFMQSNSGVSLYRYFDYKIIDTCNCNENYKGEYTVIANPVLNLRSGHGTKHSIITTIPKGEKVYISKGNGEWAHVEWNGQSGYCDMRYLEKIEASNKNISLHAWISDSKMGNVPEKFKLGETYYLCYEVLDLSTGGRFSDANYNYVVSEALYNPDGTELGTHSYENSNNNWINYSPNTPGTYKGIVTISGDFNLNVEVQYEVKTNKIETIQIQDVNGNNCSNLLLKNIGDTTILKTKISPDNAENKTVSWTSSDPTVASVDSNGNITAKKDGVTKITVTAQDGGGASASCNVRVKTYGIVYGDCNGDGAVTATDLSFMNQAVNGSLKLTETQKQIFDLNGDGIVDSKDMELLNQFILKTRTSFPVEEQLSEIVISTLPAKITYYVGDPISIQGVTVIAYYNNGTTKTVTSINIEGNTETAGRKTVTLSYTESGITKSVSYQINVREKEVIETATPVQTIQPIVTINPTIVPSPIVTSAAVVVSTPNTVVIATTLNPTQTAVNCPTATPTHVTTYHPVTGEIHSTAVPNITVSPTIKPIETTNPTKDISNNQNNQKETAEQYEEYEIADKKDALNEGDSFEINSVIYEVIDDSSDEPTVELVAIEKSNIKSVSVPATVKCEGITYKVAGIAKSAFKNNKKITSLTIGSNVTYIGSYAFYKNTKLKKITIKSLKLDKIQKKAFWGLPRRVKVILPTSKKSIYNNMLKNAGLGKR